MKITQEMLEAAGIVLNFGDSEQLELTGSKVSRELTGTYTLEDMRWILGDMERIQEAIDAGKLCAPKPEKVTIVTTQYVASHGKEPRGRGSWAFQMGGRRDAEIYWTPGSTTYVLAKSLAKIEARKRGVSTVFVLP